MVVFNLKFGQKRARAKPGTGHRNQAMKGYVMEHINKPPVKIIQMTSARDKSYKGSYHADALGNITVVVPADLNTMVGQGWPIYNGPANQQVPVTPEQLIWPEVTGALVALNNPFDKIINEALTAGSK